jgi:hypothetical protein
LVLDELTFGLDLSHQRILLKQLARFFVFRIVFCVNKHSEYLFNFKNYAALNKENKENLASFVLVLQ